MPAATAADLMLLHIATSKKAQIAALPVGQGRYPLPLSELIQQIASDRLMLAGEHLRAGDSLIFGKQFRSAISRHYYAMYHAARSIVFAYNQGDDHQHHSDLPRNLPNNLQTAAQREVELTDARLLRNKADYDPYPSGQADWEADARQLSVVAAEFLQACEEYALANGFI
jgi:uncharacterized protein (UPF0332 family)